jgi:hypothetical protein
MNPWIPLAIAGVALTLSACGGTVEVAAQSSGAGGATSSTTGGGAGTTTGAGGTGGTGGAPAVCGGSKGAICAADEWCDFAKDDCGGADDTGVCVKRPLTCPPPPPGPPLCACDGKTYPDACLAQQEGFDADPGGMCPTGTFPCGPTTNLFCETGTEYCDLSEGVVGEYQCLPLPASCLPPNMLDCACMPVPPDCGSCAQVNGDLDVTHGCG